MHNISSEYFKNSKVKRDKKKMCGIERHAVYRQLFCVVWAFARH